MASVEQLSMSSGLHHRGTMEIARVLHNMRVADPAGTL
jgi:hypothetical protein